MVHFISSVIATSALLSLAPGALAAPVRPLPLREGAQSGLMKSANAAVKRDHLKISKDYDPDHSLHWNYHHGYVNEDGHGHGYPTDRERRALERRTYTSEAEHLIDLDIEAQILKREEKRGIWLNKGNVEPSGTILNADIAGLELHLKRNGESHLSKRSPTPEPRRHHHHSDEHDHEHVHEHEHVHVHSHKRDETEPRSQEVPKRFERQAKKASKSKKGSKSGKKSSSSKKASGKKSGKSKGVSSPLADVKIALGNEKRGLEAAGVPGFVEVATPLFNPTLARTIAGLVFTTDPNPAENATSAFILGTSETQSTQFYLTNAANPDPATPSDLNVVNIRVPILDAQKLSSQDFCASFDLTPPSPLELLPCGDNDGFSQNFAYNGVTGELQPLYAATPAPMALVSTSIPASSTDDSTTAKSFAAETADEDTDDDEDEDAEMTDMGLYFVPASVYYNTPGTVNSLLAKGDNETDSTNSTAAASSSALLPANATETSTTVSSTSTSSAVPTSTSSSSSSSSAASTTISSTSSATPVPTILRALASILSSASAESASSSSASATASVTEFSSFSATATSTSSTSSVAATATETPRPSPTTLHALAEPTSSTVASSTSDAPASSSTSASSSSSATPTETPLSTLTLPSASSTVTGHPISTQASASSTVDASSSTAESASPTVILAAAGTKPTTRMIRRNRKFGRW